MRRWYVYYNYLDWENDTMYASATYEQDDDGEFNYENFLKTRSGKSKTIMFAMEIAPKK